MNEIIYAGPQAGGAKRIAVVCGVVLLAVVAFFLYERYANAEVVAGVHEGSAISATGTSDANVYIINDSGYKRWVINPSATFAAYGHLSGASVTSVSAGFRDQFQTSGLFRNCEANAEPVYALEINGTSGILHWVNVMGPQAVAEDPVFFLKVFCINAREQAMYSLGANYTSTTQIPAYSRGTSPSPTTTIIPGNVTLSVASDNQAAGSISRGSTNSPLLRFNVTNNNNAAVTVTDLSILRTGSGMYTDLSNVYLYNGGSRLAGGFAIGSNNTLTFTGLGITIPANSTVELTLTGDLSSNASVGGTNALQIQSVTASGTTASGAAIGNFFTTQ